MKIPYSEGALLEEVRKKRIAWDYTMKNHYKKNVQAKAWGEIADKLDGDFVTGMLHILT